MLSCSMRRQRRGPSPLWHAEVGSEVAACRTARQRGAGRTMEARGAGLEATAAYFSFFLFSRMCITGGSRTIGDDSPYHRRFKSN